MEALTWITNEVMTGIGWLPADWSISIISAIAAVTTMLSLTGLPSSIERVGVYLISAGWLFVALRMLMILLPGGDPRMPLLIIIALALIGTGQVFFVV